MRVLVLGATGMLGHKVVQRLHAGPFEVHAAARGPIPPQLGVPSGRLHSIADAGDEAAIARTVRRVRPDVLVNCVGIVKQTRAGDRARLIEVNSVLPHRVAQLCEGSGIRLVHFSTDCVYSGLKGSYTERDLPDPVDLYGRSKLAGEPETEQALTIRTSIIGREIRGRRSLVEWFLSQEGITTGFRRAIFSGLPTVTLADVLRTILGDHPEMSGVWHVSSDPIDKYELLRIIQDELSHDVRLVPFDTPVIDRSLDSTRFRQATGWQPQDWPSLVADLVADAELTPDLYAI